MSTVQTNISLLGLTVKDKVTGFEGVVTSVSFELYGCIQVLVSPRSNEKQKFEDRVWFDSNRIEVIDSFERSMPIPDFENIYSPVQIKSVPQKGPELKPVTSNSR